MPQKTIGPLRLFGYRGEKRTVGVASLFQGSGRGLNLGATWHRGGGFSIVGIPRRGGTSVMWGEKLRKRMDDHACKCRRFAIGRVSIHVGEDF